MDMKNSIVIGISIIIGLTIHALIGQSNSDSQLLLDLESEVSSDSGPYGQYKDLTEYHAVTKLKQSIVDQLSELQVKVLDINGEQLLYYFQVDESDNEKGVSWEHKFCRYRNDSLIEIEVY